MLGIQSRAKATIARRTIEQIKPVEFKWCSTGLTLVSNGTLPQWTVPVGQGLSIGNIVPNNSITFGNPSNPKVLVITHDGDVEWHGKPSEAAEALTRTFQFTVEDMKGVNKAARRRYYWRAIDNLAKKSKQMSAEEFVDFVQKQAYSRECKVLIDTLKGEPNVT